MADFINTDFDSLDFDTNKTSNGVIDWFFNRFALWYKRADSYKDSNDRGLLQRYMSIFDPEVLNFFYPKIENYLDIIDAQVCESKFLTHISESLGKPPDIFPNDDGYRNLLSYIVSIYKIKGTLESYRLFFDILGFESEIYEVPVTSSNSNYDIGGEYDSEEFGSYYDQNTCQPCSYYDITLYPKVTNFYSISQQLLNNIKETIKFNEPINAKLRNLDIGLRFEDSLGLLVSETDPETLIVPGSVYDGDLLYDDGIIYEPE